MIKQEKLDLFLDAFLENQGNGQTPDMDFWEEEETGDEAVQADYWERQDTFAVPVNRGKLRMRTMVSIFFVLVAIPVTIWVGVHFFNDRKYMVVGLTIAIYSMIPFFLVFEGRKPQPRELLVIAVLVAIATAGRAAFFMIGQFKPVAAVTIISGVAFGAESGFMVGALSMLTSNMLMGQGPWTPWQMFAMGLIGCLAGIAFQKGWLRAKKVPLCIFGFLATLIIYGGIMNPATLVMYSYAISLRNLLIIYMSGLPMDLVHATATAIFLWIGSKPLLEKLERIKVKYGLI